jgi:hypothetical protein
MSQLGHADPKMTLGVYAQVMQRTDGERERLEALVDGADWAPLGTSGDSEPSEVASPEPEFGSTMQVEGA